ncbi:MAG: hypothetical protein AAF581_23075 [Planctomycetota bacterium]
MIKFALALAASRHEIQLYSFCALANHLHNAFFDPKARHPLFRQDFHAAVTRSVNVHRGMSGSKWTPNDPCPVLLWDIEALLEKIAYSIANPCLHGLVEAPEQWPGAISTIEQLAGPPQVIQRPNNFYDPKGDLPKFVELRFVKPPPLADWTDDEYRKEIAKRVDTKCQEARADRRRRRKTVLGRIAVLEVSPTAAPNSSLPTGKLSPRVACKSVNLRIAFLLWLRWFRIEHREARVAFERGEYGVEFPFATYWHVLRYGVNCSTAGPPSVA